MRMRALKMKACVALVVLSILGSALLFLGVFGNASSFFFPELTVEEKLSQRGLPTDRCTRRYIILTAMPDEWKEGMKEGTHEGGAEGGGDAASDAAVNETAGGRLLTFLMA